MTDVLRIKREEAVLVAIDFQEKLLPAMHDWEKVQATMVKLATGLTAMSIPGIVTTQYAKGLGTTVEPVAKVLGESEPIDKSAFSAWQEPAFKKALEETGRRTVILTGIETHICVEQTALDLLENGFKVVLVADCVESRNHKNTKTSMKRLQQAGVVVTSYESVLYELLGSSKAPEFKTISAIVK